MHIKSLDGLRGVAAYIVVFGHFAGYPLFADIGQLGVMIFFVLSGYLMGQIYLTQRPGLDVIGVYFTNRFARIAPAYLLVVAISYGLFLLTGRVGPFPPITTLPELLEHLLFLRGAGVLWTIPVEVQFYVLFPLLWLTAYHLGRPMLVMVSLGIVWLAASVGFAAPPALAQAVQYFLAGMLVAGLPVEISRKYDIPFVAAVVVTGLSLPRVREALGLESLGQWESILHLAGATLLLLATVNSRLAQVLLGNRVAAFFGAISFSVYLLHVPVMRVLEVAGIATQENQLLGFLLVAGATTAVAFVMWRLVEVPARQALRQAGRRRFATLALAWAFPALGIAALVAVPDLQAASTAIAAP
ncbi:MAG: acyltransferase [Devosia sp.]|nr:acyltransferase [Devosia sp.]